MPRTGFLSTPSEAFVFITTLFNQGSFMSVAAQPEGQLCSVINQNPHRKSLLSTLRERKTDKCPPQAKKAQRSQEGKAPVQEKAGAGAAGRQRKQKLDRLNYRSLEYHFILTTK